MVPIDKVKDIITKHNILEKELSSGNIDSKLFAKKSKEYSSLGEIINIAKEYVNFESEMHIEDVQLECRSLAYYALLFPSI